MIFQIILALVLGLAAGTITGLIPGLHINLIAAFLLTISSIALFSSLEPIVLVLFLVSMAITHTFIDYIPSIFLGAPDEDNFLSILPGHDLLLKGQGYKAVIYTLYGSISSLIILAIFAPLFIFYLPSIYPYIQKIMHIILIIASIFLIYSERTSKILAILVFFISGILGITVLNLSSPQPLLPLFTGLFGISSLITSLNKKQEIPPQEIEKIKHIKLSKKSYFKALFASGISAPLASFLPGLGASQAAIIGSEVVEEMDQKEFLFLLGAVNTIVMSLSFITLYSINKTRTGIALTIKEIITLTLPNLLFIIGTIVIVSIVSFFLTIFLARFFSQNIHKVNYKILSLSIIVFLTIITFIFSGIIGIIILLTSTALGLFTITKGIKRSHLMGSLLLPSILYYLL